MKTKNKKMKMNELKVIIYFDFSYLKSLFYNGTIFILNTYQWSYQLLAMFVFNELPAKSYILINDTNATINSRAVANLLIINNYIYRSIFINYI
jgi:hypothetical protein